MAALSLILELFGFPTIRAYNPKEAFQLAAERRPAAALIDPALPGINGHEVARRLRTEEWGRRMLLVAVSGWDGPEDVAEAKAAGFDEHVAKPVLDLETLLRPLQSRFGRLTPKCH